MGTILSDLGLESPLVGTVVTAHVKASGLDGFQCEVHDVGTGDTSEAILPRMDAFEVAPGLAPPELKPGEAVITLVTGVSEEGGHERLLLSATSPDLVVRILAAFVEEILTGRVAVMGTARVAGTKTKIAVAPTVTGIDAKGACIGRAGSRLKAAEKLLNRSFGRERLEIIDYSSDRAAYLINAMSPVRVSDVLVEGGNAVVSVASHQMSGGIGEGGLNAQLAGRLTGLYVRVVDTEADMPAALTALAAERLAAEAAEQPDPTTT